MSLHRVSRFALLLALLTLVLLPGVGRADLASMAPIKRQQALRMLQEPAREHREWLERRRELRAMARQLTRSGKHAIRKAGAHARPEVLDGGGIVEATRSATSARLASPSVIAPPTANKRVNNPAGDGATDGQCETSIVAFGNNMVAAWNDGTGFSDLSNDSQGWATSTDAGVTWTDQGKLPKPAANPSLVWTSDPVLAVNTSTGAFYYSGLCDPANTGATSAIGLIKGRFNGSTFTWGTPSIVRTVSTSTDFLDKQWIAVNPANGKVFVSYTWFNATGDEIDVQSADSSLTTWSSAVKVSLVGENGNVQGSRPAVAPDGSLYVVYYLIGAVDVDYLRVAKSTNQGVSFGTPVNAVSFYANFGSGAPGFNRAQGIQFPSIAIERSSGPHNGRIFLTWAESMNWYDDEAAMVSTGFKAESPTDSNGTATNNNSIATATPFTIGQTLEGAMASNVDLDYWSTTLNAGQTLLVECDSLQTALDVYVRLIAPDGVTRLALSEASNTAGAVSASYWIFTAPTTGTYYVRIGAISSSGRSAYRVRTGFASNTGERGRDQRDVSMCYSDNGTTWSTPVRVTTSPIGYDDWLPEIAVTGDATNLTDGDRVYVTWYDWRNATASTCGGESQIMLAKSDDGGTSFYTLGPTSDAKSAWTSVSSNIAPNQGDYQSLWVDANQLVACWGDGRDGNPNVYMSRWTLAQTPVGLSLVSSSATQTAVTLTWYAVDGPQLSARVERSTDGATWTDLGLVLPNAEGMIREVDGDVTPGQTYQYRLRVTQNGAERFSGITTITVPARITFALEGARPNPAVGAPSIAFSLADDAPATLSLLDVTGRLIVSRAVGTLGGGAHVLSLDPGRTLRPGVYLVRLTQRGQSLTSRVSLVR